MLVRCACGVFKEFSRVFLMKKCNSGGDKQSRNRVNFIKYQIAVITSEAGMINHSHYSEIMSLERFTAVITVTPWIWILNDYEIFTIFFGRYKYYFA